MGTSGYLIVRPYEALFDEAVLSRRYDRPPFNERQVYAIPSGTSPLTPTKLYLGTDREPLAALSFADGEKYNPLRIAKGGTPLPVNLATHLMTQLESMTEWDDSLIGRFGDLRRVWVSLEREQRRYEVIFQREPGDTRAPPLNTTLLGFDVSYTNSDHFSCICDALFLPKWHGTDDEGVLFRAHFGRLNGNGLFPSVIAAEDYMRYYHSFDWTEHPEGTAVLELHTVRI